MVLTQYTFNKNDEYYTPSYVVYPLLDKLKPHSTIWCPFDTENSMYVKVFQESGHNVVRGHIATGQDFFQTDCINCDYIISNPPFSIKTEVFKRLYELGKPFAMLMNFHGLFDSKERFELFKGNRTEIIWLSPRVDYINPNGDVEKGVPFQSVYVCSGVCTDQMNFINLDKHLKYPLKEAT